VIDPRTIVMEGLSLLYILSAGEFILHSIPKARLKFTKENGEHFIRKLPPVQKELLEIFTSRVNRKKYFRKEIRNMKLTELIAQDMKEAMKCQEKFTLSVLRLLKSGLQLESIKEKKELEDKDVITVIKRNVKQRKDSIVEFEKYGKIEEVESLKKEIEVLQKYLPEELNEEEIDEVIASVFAELKPESIKDMGRIMKSLTDQIGDRADMSIVSKKVKEKL